MLAVVGAGAGAAGGFGVGGGLAFAESRSRLRHAAGLTIGAAAGGAAVGTAVQWLMRSILAALFGLSLPIGGAVEGLVIGAAAGTGYAFGRRSKGTPPSAAGVAALCAAAALVLAWTGRPLVGGTLHLIAREARGSQISLAPPRPPDR